MKHLPVLQGTRVILRAMGPADADAMFQSLSNIEIMRLTGSHGDFTLSQVQKFCEQVASDDDRADFVITLSSDPATPRGEVVLNNIDRDNRACNFRISLYDEADFGQGMGSEATQLILQYGFDVLGLHRIELEVYAFNSRAIRSYEKVGFTREGIRRDALLWDGEYVDAICMSILRHEFKV